MSPLLDLIGSAKGYGWGALTASSSYESITSATGTGSSSIITFSSIPQTYKHLQIRGIARGADAISAPGNLQLRYNGVTTSTYFTHRLSGNGSSVVAGGNASSSAMGTVGVSAGSTSTANIHGVFVLDILDYTSTTKTKTLKSFAGIDTNSGSANDIVYLISGSSTATTAITSITITNTSENHSTTTSFALYGIKG